MHMLLYCFDRAIWQITNCPLCCTHDVAFLAYTFSHTCLIILRISETVRNIFDFLFSRLNTQSARIYSEIIVFVSL